MVKHSNPKQLRERRVYSPPIPVSQSVTEGSQARKELKAGTWMQELK